MHCRASEGFHRADHGGGRNLRANLAPQYPSSRIRTDRPASRYLHFGYGLHSCFGRFISYEAQIPGMMKALLKQSNLRRVPGPAGRLTWDGPFPDSLKVAFDPS
jgi:cytochrome P450